MILNTSFIADPEIEIVDIAVPPDSQLPTVKEIVKQKDHVKGVFYQKPLTMNYQDAKESVELCEEGQNWGL